MSEAVLAASGCFLMVLSIGIGVWADGKIKNLDTYNRIFLLCFTGAITGSVAVSVASLQMLFG